MYLPKRIHFGSKTFNMRMNLALMDWVRDCVHVHVVLQMYMVILLVKNENVARASTSEKLKYDPKRPDRRTPRKALVEKSFHFTHHIWEVYIHDPESPATRVCMPYNTHVYMHIIIIHCTSCTMLHVHVVGPNISVCTCPSYPSMLNDNLA